MIKSKNKRTQKITHINARKVQYVQALITREN